MNKFAVQVAALICLFPATAFSQWYVGGTIGQYELNEVQSDRSALISPRGGYRFNNVLSIETSYVFFSETDLDDPRYYNETLEGGMIDLGLVVTIPITRRFEIFGRAGLGYYAVNVDDWGYNADDTGNAWNYGGGIAFNINRNFSIFGGYQKYEFDVSGGDDLSADTIYAGLNFFFDFSAPGKSSKVAPSAGQYEPQKSSNPTPQLRAVSESEKGQCTFVETISAGSGGPGDPTVHTENAMHKALISASEAGADSYFVVDINTTSEGASVVLEALDCN